MKKYSQEIQQEKYMKKFKKAHGDKYDLSNFVYTRANDHFDVWCERHQEYFSTTPKRFALGQGCPKCGVERRTEMAKKSVSDFIYESKQKHGDTYSYELCEDLKTLPQKVPLICKEHGLFYQRWKSHIRGAGCEKCARQVVGRKCSGSLEEFISKSKLLHGDRYDYSECKEYKNNRTVMPIRCKKHGIFHQRAVTHLVGSGCPSCAAERRADSCRGSWDVFVSRAVLAHGDLYIYPTQEYVNTSTRVEIVCKNHGSFWQRPANHIKGEGCPYCANEKRSWYRHGHYSTTLPAIFYMLKMKDSEKEWLKVGITKDLRKRLNGFTTGIPDGWEFSLIHTWEGPAWECFNLEWFTLYENKIERYKEESWDWAGYTECFRYEDYEPLVQHINSVADTLIGVCQTK